MPELYSIVNLFNGSIVYNQTFPFQINKAVLDKIYNDVTCFD